MLCEKCHMAIDAVDPKWTNYVSRHWEHDGFIEKWRCRCGNSYTTMMVKGCRMKISELGVLVVWD